MFDYSTSIYILQLVSLSLYNGSRGDVLLRFVLLVCMNVHSSAAWLVEPRFNSQYGE